MPNWTTHMGGAYLVARPWGKKNLRFFLLGAVLPDFIARLEALSLDLFELDLFPNYALEAFHTPLLVFLLSILIASFSKQFKKCCGLIFAGGLLHILMDMLERKTIHSGAYLLFPFSYQTFQLNFLPRSETWLYFSWAICLCILLYAAWEKKENIICLQAKAPGPRVLALLGIILFIPLLTSASFRTHCKSLRFIQNPAAFEGRQVSLYVSEVVTENQLVVREHFHDFPVVTSQRFKKGEWISLEGIYRQGKIYPNRIQRELGVKTKSLLSLPALLLFPFIWWDWRRVSTRTLGNKQPPQFIAPQRP